MSLQSLPALRQSADNICDDTRKPVFEVSKTQTSLLSHRLANSATAPDWLVLKIFIGSILFRQLKSSAIFKRIHIIFIVDSTINYTT